MDSTRVRTAAVAWTFHPSLPPLVIPVHSLSPSYTARHGVLPLGDSGLRRWLASQLDVAVVVVVVAGTHRLSSGAGGGGGGSGGALRGPTLVND